MVENLTRAKNQEKCLDLEFHIVPTIFLKMKYFQFLILCSDLSLKLNRKMLLMRLKNVKKKMSDDSLN